MGRVRLAITQGDIQRALKAAKKAGLDVLRYEVGGGKLVVTVKEDGTEQRKVINPLDSAPTFFSARKGRK